MIDHSSSQVPFLFQSTRSAGGETLWDTNDTIIYLISIHSPRRGRDWEERIAEALQTLFQSTRPAGGETIVTPDGRISYGFQSTRPAGGETRLAI